MISPLELTGPSVQSVWAGFGVHSRSDAALQIEVSPALRSPVDAMQIQSIPQKSCVRSKKIPQHPIDYKRNAWL
jgi:hypothetical protein